YRRHLGAGRSGGAPGSRQRAPRPGRGPGRPLREGVGRALRIRDGDGDRRARRSRPAAGRGAADRVGGRACPAVVRRVSSSGPRAPLPALPPDPTWIVAFSRAASVCADLGDRAAAGRLYPFLAPYADRIVGNGVVWIGSVAHYLGVLATTLEHFDEAERYVVA